MNQKYIYSLIAVLALFLIAYVGSEAAGLQILFGIILPYLAIIAFLGGFIVRILDWAGSSVPFAIPTTCGQQKSLPWIKPNAIDNPTSTGAVVLRMFFEIVFFRSLFRNTRMGISNGSRVFYKWEIFLWIGSLAFHYSFLTVILRHLRFFIEPVPSAIILLENIDSFFKLEFITHIFQIGLPGFYLSGLILLAAVTYLFLRRIFISQVKYISLAADFFPLFLIFGIAFSGILMRYVIKVDITAVKELTMGFITFHPVIPKEGISGIFYVHLFFVAILLAYFPFSKLMHMAGVFLSPTRNMANNTRAVRHINPWNYPVPVHTYEEYEDEFREKMIDVGLPVDKMPDEKPEEIIADQKKEGKE